MDHWRGVSSYSNMTMTVHRSDWERSFSMRGWTRGTKTSLVRVTAPKKDAGNGTLILDTNMWSYTPKVNRIIKVPSSMMSQSWMGSDFSNKDVSKSTDLIDMYDHTLIHTEEKDGHTFYTIQSIPHEEAAVVWGKEVIRMRDDYVLLEQTFFDQDMQPLKHMVSLEIGVLGGRAFATRMRMVDLEEDDRWTELEYRTAEFDLPLDDELFTLFSLRNPRRR